ncbi:hypothetical protein FNV43_RR17077 [Rhamnella rubrinervis]|uniref:Uncharacterized protein n=1 Tax=Rhamnella rubrinervis TaxID=2594499 RepID=A0A8K0GZZ9_9ROSA|nr:hypothetical protein FNV43_RR17077 [Rhamnella rubrinervis]
MENRSKPLVADCRSALVMSEPIQLQALLLEDILIDRADQSFRPHSGQGMGRVTLAPPRPVVIPIIDFSYADYGAPPHCRASSDYSGGGGGGYGGSGGNNFSGGV